MELTEGSETSAIINQTPGNYPKGNLLYSVHGESLKSRLPYILESNPHPFYSFRGLKNQMRGRELDFGKTIEPLYVL